jgi:hypothetical protein
MILELHNIAISPNSGMAPVWMWSPILLSNKHYTGLQLMHFPRPLLGSGHQQFDNMELRIAVFLPVEFDLS